MFELGLTVVIFIIFVAYMRHQQVMHQRRIDAYAVRIHVNGIRGKSTVTRLVSGALRQAGFRTVAKTTGSAAVTIDPDGRDVPIQRQGAPNVKEQQDIIAQWEPLNPEAMIIECMALQPKYQEWTEKMIVQAHIGVITNVREDHQDVMGETLPEIAVSLAHMCPYNGTLITAEYDPELQAILRAEAEKRGSKLVVADPARVRDDEIAHFDYLSFKDNVAVGLAVADLLGIDRDVAMEGMIHSQPDIGVVRLQQTEILGKPVTWANLFAVNDRESMIISMDMLEAACDDRTLKIGILNNRYDRERRAEQFSDIAANDLRFDWLITFGAYEDLVTRKLVANGFPAGRIVNLGFSVNPSLDDILAAIAGMIPAGYRAMLVGFVNIHTPQAELMMEYFAEAAHHTAAGSVEPALMPGMVQRQRFEMAHG